jgi:hemolysin activation/secretion protein
VSAFNVPRRRFRLSCQIGASLRAWLLMLASLPTVGVGVAVAQAQAEQQTAPARFTVKAFALQGVTLVPEAALQAALQPWLNKPITMLHLQHAARTLAEVYRTQGWPERPAVPTQQVSGDVVTFGVAEARLLDAAKFDTHLAELVQQAQQRQQARNEPTTLLAALTKNNAGVDAGSLLREIQRDDVRRQAPPLPARPVQQQGDDAAAAAQRMGPGPSFQVKAFRISGASLVNEASLQMALASYLSRPLVFADLQAAMAVLADVYRSQGWLARPQLPAQDLVDGVVQVHVVEARLGEVQIDTADRPLRFDRGRLVAVTTARQQSGQPLNVHEVDRAVQLLNNTPGLRASAVLVPGREPGHTDIVLQPQDQALLAGHVALDNQGTRAAGAQRLSGTVALQSPSGVGDELRASAQTTAAGNHSATLSYSRPVGDEGASFSVNASTLNYRLQGDFAAAQSEGNARTLGLMARYPMRRHVNLSLGLEHRAYRNSASAELLSIKRLTSLTANMSGDSAAWSQLRSDAGADPRSFTQWRVGVSAGRVDLSALDANQAADAAGPRTAGRYARLTLNLSHLQSLGTNASLLFSASGQWASKNLDSAEKFSLGGPNGVRAYPGLEGTGDSGWLASAEWRYSLLPTLQLSAFYDHGQVQVNQQPDFSGAALINRVSLKGVGLGLNWSPLPQYSLRAQMARRLGANPLAHALTGADADGSHSLMRSWLGLSALF